MTPDMEKQIASVRTRWERLSGLTHDSARVFALQREGWAQAAIDIVRRENSA